MEIQGLASGENVANLNTSGNGRKLFLKQLVKEGRFEKDYGEARDRWCAEHGITFDKSAYAHPVLVRRIVGGLRTRADLVKFCDECNEGKVLELSEVEQALKDLKQIDPAIFKLYEGTRDGNLIDPNAKGFNDAFFQAFFKAVGSTGLTDAQGYPTDLAQRRMMNALVAYLFGVNDDTLALVAALLESKTSLGLGRLYAALASNAADLIATDADPRHREYAIMRAVREAAKMYITWRFERRVNKTLLFETHLSQLGFAVNGDGAVQTPTIVRELAKLLEAERFGTVLKEYRRLAAQQPSADDIANALIPMEAYTPEQLLAMAERNLTDKAWHDWNRYNALPKRVAFRNGKLVAFMATDIDRGEQWWDRADEPHDGIPFTRSVPSPSGEGANATEHFELLPDGNLKTFKITRGAPNAKTGTFEEWLPNGAYKLRETKDGVEVRFERHDENGVELEHMERSFKQGLLQELSIEKNSEGEIKRMGVVDGFSDMNAYQSANAFLLDEGPGIAYTTSHTFRMDEQTARELYYALSINDRPVVDAIVAELKAKAQQKERFSVSLGERGAARLEDNGNAILNLKAARKALGDRDWTALTRDEKVRIKMATGWEKGADGKWRLERENLHIVDGFSGKNVADPRNITLGEFFGDHILFKAYPDMRDMVVHRVPRFDARGRYNPTTGDITILEDIKTRHELERILTHEVQHAIQYREGFAIGGPSGIGMWLGKYRQFALDGYQKLRDMGSGYDDVKLQQLGGEYAYNHLAGEIEANNVSERDFNDLRQGKELLEDTESNPRGEQYVLFDEFEPEAQHLVNASDIDSRDGTEIVAVGKLSEAIKNGASRKDHYEHFRLAKTSDVLKQYGMTGEYLTIGAKVVFAHYAKDPDHALSEQDWANISEALKDPLVIAKYSLLRKDGTRYYPPKSYRVWVKAVVNGHFANVGVEVKSPSANTTVNSISTVYGDEFVHINPKDVLYSLGKGEGIRTLLDGPNSRRYSESPALIDSIAYSGAEVNPVQTKNETPAEREQMRHSVFVGVRAAKRIGALEPLVEAGKILHSDFGGEYTPEARDTIYVKTGWWRGTDGLWRFEIRDMKPKKRGETLRLQDGSTVRENGMYRFADTGVAFCPLSDMVSHTQLFKAYPGLKELPVLVGDPDDMGTAAAWFNGREIRLNWDLVEWFDDAESNVLTQRGLSILTHEVQHAVQSFEGFALGGSTEVNGPQNYARLAGEVEARNAGHRAALAQLGGPFGKAIAHPARVTRAYLSGEGYAPWDTETRRPSRWSSTS